MSTTIMVWYSLKGGLPFLHIKGFETYILNSRMFLACRCQNYRQGASWKKLEEGKKDCN